MFNTNLDTLLLLFRFRTGSMTDVNSYSFSARQCPEMVIDSCRWQTRRRKDFVQRLTYPGGLQYAAGSDNNPKEAVGARRK